MLLSRFHRINSRSICQNSVVLFLVKSSRILLPYFHVLFLNYFNQALGFHEIMQEKVTTILAVSLVGLLLLLGVFYKARIRKESEETILKPNQKKLQQANNMKEKGMKKVMEQNNQEVDRSSPKDLEIELVNKNKELALMTIQLVQRNELILKLQEPLTKILSTTTDKKAIVEIKRINKLLLEKVKVEDSWNQFATHFDQIHVDFITKLRAAYPQLTTNDRKLCAYLRMSLSSKEIAPLMSISVRGVEVARYRIRKKLNLDSDTNLTEFMLGI